MALGNSYFQFKQFVVHQDACAMKVTTDACILGAYIKVQNNEERILDIGAGTGLLALMLAQATNNVFIDAIEINPDAARQAAENILGSPWSERIKVLNCDIRSYRPPFHYDAIITNPPFFNDSLLSGIAEQDSARHTISLSFAELLQSIAALLGAGGCWWVILPADGFANMRDIAIAQGWHLHEQLDIKHTAQAQTKRIIGKFSEKPNKETHHHELVIKCPDNQYTPEFIRLLQPYYLHL